MKYKPSCPYCSHKFHWSEATRLDIEAGQYHQCPECKRYVVWGITIYPPNIPPSWGKPVPDNLEAIRKAADTLI